MYLTYNFIDKDPVVDELRTAIADAGFTDKLAYLANQSGVSYATVKNLLFGKTVSPRNATIEALFRACGVERRPVRVSAPRIDFTHEKPRRFRYIKGGRK